MIKIENTQVYGFEAAIRGMRNPKNSWEKSDSGYGDEDADLLLCNPSDIGRCYTIGDNDMQLMQTLCKAGSDHRKFLRFITVTFDIIAPLYWWKEFDTYKVGTVANSCSTMHKIHAKEFTLDDFSTDKLSSDGVELMEKHIIPFLEESRKWFNAKSIYDPPEFKKQCWYDMIQTLPASYNQRRTVLLNYEVLRNQYHARKNHKLDEWHDYCHWIETLPYAKELICE